jgi:hypothetical protein
MSTMTVSDGTEITATHQDQVNADLLGFLES